MSTLIHERVALAHQGQNPTVVCQLPSGWLVFSDTQLIPGYCILLSDPVVPSLNEMPLEARAAFLNDMARVGDALLKVTGAARINYEILGNADPALHAHIIPRHDHEPETLRRKPIWFYDFTTAPKFDPERDRALMESLRQALSDE